LLFRPATLAAILMLAAVFLSSCGVETNYKDNQLSSVFPLRQLVQKTETSKTSDGSYLLFFASYHSQESNADYIKMFAKVSGNYRLISVPIEKIRININDSLTTPTLQVRYNGLPKTDEDVFESWYERCFIISCPEKYLPEKLLPISL
jgi:hypothetical protein